MKELTIEEKAKRYDEAIEMAKEWHKKGYGHGCQEVIEDLFPELAESKGERIRRCILETIRSSDYKSFFGAKKEDCVAWLEKQGEQKFEQKFFINDKVVHKATGKIWTIHYYLKDTNSYYVEDNDGLLHHYRESELKLVEQKPAEWSEEDKFCIQALLRYCEQYQIKDSDRLRCLNWLKFLKDRCTWKPSEEEMKALEFCLEHNIDKDGVFGSKVVKLYNELKKLREE